MSNEKTDTAANPETQLVTLPPQAIQRKMDAAAWNALVELYDGASPQMIGLVSDYCSARRLDPLKKPVHIVPVWSNRRKQMVETLWPSIAETRITAMRTGKFAGTDDTKWGPTLKWEIPGNANFEYPEWAQVTVYRMVEGNRCAFPGPRVYWIEAYATKSKDDTTPNSMWAKRTWGQLEKCAEAAALRRAFPEELGGISTAEEVHSRILDEDLVNVTNSVTVDAGNGEVRRAAVPGKLAKGAAALTAPETVVEPAREVTVAAAEPPANTPAPATPEVAPTPEPEKAKRTRRTKEQIAADEKKAAEAAAAATPAAPTSNPVTEPTPADQQPSAAKPAEPAAAPANPPPSRGPAPEWPKVVTATIFESKMVKTKNDPNFPEVKVVMLDGAKVTVNGETIDVRMLGKLVVLPQAEELQGAITDPSDQPVEFTIDEMPSKSNPQAKNRMIIKAEAPVSL